MDPILNVPGGVTGGVVEPTPPTGDFFAGFFGTFFGGFFGEDE